MGYAVDKCAVIRSFPESQMHDGAVVNMFASQQEDPQFVLILLIDVVLVPSVHTVFF